jgi:sec-independent protein translocase protein TatA
MPSIGPMELVIVLVIALLVVGPKKLPALGRSLGGGMREFKDSVSGQRDALAASIDLDEEPPAR